MLVSNNQSTTGNTSIGLRSPPLPGCRDWRTPRPRRSDIWLLIPVSLLGVCTPPLVDRAHDQPRFVNVARHRRVRAGVMAPPLVWYSQVLRVSLGAEYDASATAPLARCWRFANSLRTRCSSCCTRRIVRHASEVPSFELVRTSAHDLSDSWVRITGAAAAWTARASLDMCLFLWGGELRFSSLCGRVLRTSGGILVLLTGFGVSRFSPRCRARRRVRGCGKLHFLV